MKPRGKFYNPKNTEVSPSKNVVNEARKEGISVKLLGMITEMCKRKVMDVTIEYYSIAVAYTLWKKFHFGTKRLPEIMKAIEDMMADIENGDVNLTTMKSELDSIGVEISKEIVYREDTKDEN
jgi:hypothetical protein